MATNEPVSPHSTAADLYSLPLTVDIVTAGRLYGLGRDAAYAAGRDGSFPVPVTRVGRRIFVRRADLLRDLGVSA